MDRRQLLTIGAGSLLLRGQSKEFEAASIKPSAPIGMGMVRVGIDMMPGGRISMTGVSVKLLIQQAYGVRDFQIVGGPGWIGSERYDIVAKPEGTATSEEVKPMIQGLLADRFKLQFHRETKELPTYALVVAKGGSKLHPSETQDAGPEKRKGSQMRMMRGKFDVEDAPVAALANQLAQILGRSVIDKTELQGNYDFKLEWTPDESEGGMPKGGPEMRVEVRDAPTGPSLTTALQEQLGLKLESTKGPVEILIIDRVEKASEN